MLSNLPRRACRACSSSSPYVRRFFSTLRPTHDLSPDTTPQIANFDTHSKENGHRGVNEGTEFRSSNDPRSSAVRHIPLREGAFVYKAVEGVGDKSASPSFQEIVNDTRRSLKEALCKSASSKLRVTDLPRQYSTRRILALFGPYQTDICRITRHREGTPYERTTYLAYVHFITKEKAAEALTWAARSIPLFAARPRFSVEYAPSEPEPDPTPFLVAFTHERTEDAIREFFCPHESKIVHLQYVPSKRNDHGRRVILCCTDTQAAAAIKSACSDLMPIIYFQPEEEASSTLDLTNDTVFPYVMDILSSLEPWDKHVIRITRGGKQGTKSSFRIRVQFATKEQAITAYEHFSPSFHITRREFLVQFAEGHLAKYDTRPSKALLFYAKNMTEREIYAGLEPYGSQIVSVRYVPPRREEYGALVFVNCMNKSAAAVLKAECGNRLGMHIVYAHVLPPGGAISTLYLNSPTMLGVDSIMSEFGPYAKHICKINRAKDAMTPGGSFYTGVHFTLPEHATAAFEHVCASKKPRPFNLTCGAPRKAAPSDILFVYTKQASLISVRTMLQPVASSILEMRFFPPRANEFGGTVFLRCRDVEAARAIKDTFNNGGMRIHYSTAPWPSNYRGLAPPSKIRSVDVYTKGRHRGECEVEGL
ncbi:hypothetical protein PM082_019931 [Marasmius tenuissimus]|nr:hypothetical protein PM082_019931 [Marasmius tenuissimus]